MDIKIGKVSKTRLETLTQLCLRIILRRSPFDKHMRMPAREVLELVTELKGFRKEING